MSKILVTGGAGFIGSHVVDAYIGAGHDVVVVDSLETGSKSHVNPGARFYEMDILGPSLEAVIAQEKPTMVNHHAAQASISQSVADPVQDARTNILGSVGLLELARKYGVPHFIFASSGGAVYGRQQSYPASEDHALNPVNAYGIAKLAVEKYLEYYREVHQIRSVAFRYANVYGPRQDPHGEAGVVAIFIGALQEGKAPIIYGDGYQTRDFVHVGDVVRANILALDLLHREDEAARGESPVLNIGTGQETSIREIFDRLASIVGGTVKCQFEAARVGEIRRSVVDWGQACKVLNWKPSVSLEEGLRETVAWFLRRDIPH
ncbi:MAG: NAD-dependent epimerase/dehydratase family protein [Candidatus Methylomirabilales bacterium]